LTAAAPPSPPAGAGALLRLVGLGALVGIPAGLAAALFLAAVHELQHGLWTALPEALGASSPPWYLVIGLPVVGAAIVVAARVLLPGDGGHPPLGGLSMVPTPLAHVPGVVLATLGALGFGAVLGPEAPVIALGSAVAIAVTAFAKLEERQRTQLGMAGSFSAISALFGGPLVAGVMLVEGGVGLGAALIPALLPSFVAAAVGYTVFIGLGDWGGLGTPGLAVPDLETYDGTHVLDLAVAVAVGVATAFCLALVRGLATRVGGLRMSMTALLMGGGLAVGLLAALADVLGADPQDVLFSGQASIPALVAEDATAIVVLLFVAKGLAYAISLACGFRGGPIFPAIFLGIALATLPVIWFDVSPTLAVAAGAAAGMAAQTRLLLSAMLFAALLVSTAGLDTAPAAVLAAAAAWITATALDRRHVEAAQAAPAS
jgi:H+/Cl- antiporter ClcA